jgi:hypothetical protein
MWSDYVSQGLSGNHTLLSLSAFVLILRPIDVSGTPTIVSLCSSTEQPVEIPEMPEPPEEPMYPKYGGLDELLRSWGVSATCRHFN